MITNENPSSALLLGYWRQLKCLRSGLTSPSLSTSQAGDLMIQVSTLKRYLFQFYVQDACTNAYSHWRREVPKKSLMSAEDAVAVVLMRMWKDMDDFDPDYARQEDWLKPGSNMFMQWFNSAVNSRLIGALQDEKRRLMNFPRKTPQQLRQFHGGMAKLRQKLGKEPTLEEYLDEYGWDKISEVSNELLFSQVFSQSNSKPGEHTDQELRFDGDRRRQEPQDQMSADQAMQKMRERWGREAQIMQIVGDPDLQMPIIAYWFWGWNIPRIADVRGVSVTLISKRKRLAEELVGAYFGTRENMEKFIKGELQIPPAAPKAHPKSMELPKISYDFPE